MTEYSQAPEKARMTVCRCGCGHRTANPSGWARRGCSLRAISPAERSARSKAWARDHAEVFRAAGRKGNAVRRKAQWDDLLDKWTEIARTKGPSYALREAYRRGYISGYHAGRERRASRVRAA
jgi:hypothetical protein